MNVSTAPGISLSDKFANIRKPLEQAVWLPKQLYLDELMYALETERIFKKEWLYIGQECDVAEVGSYITATLFDQPLLLIRDKTGKVRCFYNVCRHRAMPLVSGRGNTAALLCPYHAWNYDLSGQLKTAPQMSKTEGFNACDIRLPEVRTEIVEGLVFVTFNDAATPLATLRADLISTIKPWNIADMRLMCKAHFDVEANWKLVVENGIESYHTLMAHKESFQPYAPAEISSIVDNPQRRNLVEVHTVYEKRGVMPSGPHIPNLPDWVHERSKFLFMLPNFIISLSADSISLFILHIGPSNVRFEWSVYVPSPSLKWEGIDRYRAETKAWMDQINSEDQTMIRGVQAGLLSDAYSPGRYSHLEKGVWQFHNWYADRMLDIESGSLAPQSSSRTR